ncbi:MAG: methylhydantoinase [Rhodobacteraceae bacterium]|jgi:N-methylhydantoinase A|uniref:N-methylhydantoinase A n=1 Tax=Salipiger profundus TaxID=1229727 RepID=A0A1U7D8J5_9RHOB|nr:MULTISPECIES: hydantoinase/oxoprolinase family protein [Salipiger]APX24494.1 N-methylhydantoinase A [Salipiger profundus]MAB07206.1 methylhydantoinase [Paracoccaceae bacterium]GGA18894.1 methylhydantoinase [Salipiger profundus]SFD40305.1 N-methylhydantoinase A [Salipiger profundus]
MTETNWNVGIDVGGTFTDIAAVNLGDGRMEVLKLPSTPDAPDRAMMEGVTRLAERLGISPAAFGRVAHGTTVATNALIQERGARLALVTTRGFRDVLEIGRQIRPHMFDFHTDSPAPLVPRERRFEVTERLLSDGSVHVPLTEAEIDRVVGAVAASGADACAVCLVHAYRNPEHEARIGAALKQRLPGIFLSLSHKVHPEFREFERFSTTAINGFVQPEMARYLSRLEEALAGLGSEARIGINQSSGGLVPIGRATDFPVRTALSGPAAGMVGVLETLGDSSSGNFITLDMGGTSADVSLVRDMKPAFTTEREIEGRPVKLSSVDINAVGAGGGSIAWIDTDGLMKVGPHSAGAVPGPACYSRGGTVATVSDANLFLGRLSPVLLDGEMHLDTGAASRVVADLAGALGLTPEETALGIIEIVDATMVRAVRQISVERGLDPTRFDLVAFGGAGPLHGVAVARALGIARVIIPARPGLLCAEGLLNAPLREDYVLPLGLRLDADGMAGLRTGAAALTERADLWFAQEAARGEGRVSLIADLRYVGQNYELRVPYDSASTQDSLRTAFVTLHREMYGHADEAAPVEMVALRAEATVALPRASEPAALSPGHLPQVTGVRPVIYDARGPREASIYRRESIGCGRAVTGPAIIEQTDSTIVLGPEDRATADARGNLVIEVQPHD